MNIKKSIKDMWVKVSPKTYVKYEYKKRFGANLNLNNPENFNEKILWLIFNWQHPLVVQCADKYRMRQFVEDRGLGSILPKLYGVWEDASTIDWDALPQEFVIKCNHGCKMNIICKDKDSLDRKASAEKLDKWMHTNYGSNVYEPHYSYIKPIILAEEYIKNPGLFMPVDYKIYCFNGKPKLVMACVEREQDVQFEWYDFDWNVIDIGAKENQRKAKKPESLSKMIECSKQLCEPFPFVRVDFYERNGEPILGELTFTPYFGMANYYSKEGCLWLGEKIALPEPYGKHFE